VAVDNLAGSSDDGRTEIDEGIGLHDIVITFYQTTSMSFPHFFYFLQASPDLSSDLVEVQGRIAIGD
jgi:hypothetical protein